MLRDSLKWQFKCTTDAFSIIWFRPNYCITELNSKVNELDNALVILFTRIGRNKKVKNFQFRMCDHIFKNQLLIFVLKFIQWRQFSLVKLTCCYAALSSIPLCQSSLKNYIWNSNKNVNSCNLCSVRFLFLFMGNGALELPIGRWSLLPNITIFITITIKFIEEEKKRRGKSNNNESAYDCDNPN